jgi:hypothetical protein
MRPRKKLTNKSRTSEANLRTKEAVFWTRSPAVVKKDQTSSTSEVKTSERDLMMDDMLIDGDELSRTWIRFKIRVGI